MRWWRPRIDPLAVDIALATAVVIGSTFGLVGPGTGPMEGSPLRWVLGVAVALPLLMRRRAPEAALVAVTGVALVQAVVLREMPTFGAFLALLIVAFSVGAHARFWPGLLVMAISLGGVLLVGAVSEPLSAEGVVIPFVYLGGAWGIGRLVGERSARADQLASTADRLVGERAERERAILVDERARISRELHDVVAHAVTTMVLQAGAAQAELGREDGATRARLVTIESSGRQALDELRRVLSVMRDPATSGVEDPMPGIGDLAALVERTEESGVTVGLSVEVADELPPGLQLSVYRIVQEALTNVLRHAAASKAAVRVRQDADAVTVEILDDGHGPGGGSLRGSGRGLIGMRERAALFGGTVEASGLPDADGFRVVAHLPLREAAR